MAFIGGKDLASFLTVNNIVIDEDGLNDYRPKKIKQAAYELSLGDEVYLTDSKEKKTIKLDNNNDTININPGQFALLLTKEIVHLPNSVLGFISIKASEKLKGLINVSGFHVDPGFKGKLLFSVYNASPSVIQLRRGCEYFLIWFSLLKNPVCDKYSYNSKNHQDQDHITPKYISPLLSGEIASPAALSQQIKDNKFELDKLSSKTELRNEKVFWAITVGIALLISGNIALWANRGNYEKGYSDAVKNMEYKDLAKKVSVLTTDSVYLHMVDSLIDLKIKKENVKK
ncbi:dCTP deaminase domain-containing protein [Sphingobacterium thalpophilum]|uniref:dCTP deaminase domain-containing protein n=1 Tax=Sphingobacterium thalpophilum TaxID=259 RepID=UPI003D9985CE